MLPFSCRGLIIASLKSSGNVPYSKNALMNNIEPYYKLILCLQSYDLWIVIPWFAGHVDHYFNGGNLQPGCKNPLTIMREITKEAFQPTSILDLAYQTVESEYCHCTIIVNLFSLLFYLSYGIMRTYNPNSLLYRCKRTLVHYGIL